MLGFVGLASLGISVLTAHRITVSALVALVLGLVMAAQIRPHVAALVIVALAAAAAAAVAWPSRASSSRLRQIVIVIVALGFLSIAMSQVATYFGAEEGEVTDVFDFAQARTDTGGSAFAPVRVTGPQNFVSRRRVRNVSPVLARGRQCVAASRGAREHSTDRADHI